MLGAAALAWAASSGVLGAMHFRGGPTIWVEDFAAFGELAARVFPDGDQAATVAARVSPTTGRSPSTWTAFSGTPMHGRGLFRRYPRTDAFKVGRVYDLGAVVFVGLRQTFGRRSLLARERFYRLEAGWPIPFFEAVGRTDSGPSVTDWRWGIERSGTFSCDGVRLQRVIPTRPRWGAIAVFMIVVMAVGEGGGRALDAARRRRRRRRGRCAACGYPAPDGAPTCPECGGAIARSFAPPSLA